jgi:hypothetical protein
MLEDIKFRKIKLVLNILIFIVILLNINIVFSSDCLNSDDGVNLVNIDGTNEYYLNLAQDKYTDSVKIISTCPSDEIFEIHLSDNWYWEMEYRGPKHISLDIKDTQNNDVNNVYLYLDSNINIYVKNLKVHYSEKIDPFTSTFSSNIPKIIIDEGVNSEINMYNKIYLLSDTLTKGPFINKIKLNNILVKNNAKFNISVTGTDWSSSCDLSKNILGSGREYDHIYVPILDLFDISDNHTYNFAYVKYTHTNLQTHFYQEGDGLHGFGAILDLNSITNYGTTNVKLFGGDGRGGNNGTNHNDRSGGLGGFGGDAELKLKYINNYNGNLNISLFPGNGGPGGDGSNEGGSIRCEGSPQNGGDGGLGGNIFIDLNSIINYKNLNLKASAGNGNIGGDAGSNHCLDDDASGGHGGHGGSIFIEDINYIFNGSEANLFFDFNAGSGARGGYKTKGGNKGYAGFGGIITGECEYPEENNITITRDRGLYIYNIINSGVFNMKLLSGKGVTDNEWSKYSAAGSLSDIYINYFDNNSEDFRIQSRINQKNLDYIYIDYHDEFDYLLKTSSLYINYLRSGSYLPKEIILSDTINDSPDWKSTPEIAPVTKINTCYINQSDNRSLFYQIFDLNILSTNKNHYISSFNNDLSEIAYFYSPKIFCPYCDALPLDSPQRVNKNYSIYSDLPGTIKAGDLNIFYANKEDPKTKFTLPAQSDPYLVYTNVDDIISEPCSEEEFLGLNKYKIEVNNLLFVPDQYQLDPDTDRAYCPAQNYYIEGIVTDNSGNERDFNFMFVPVYDLN